MDFVDIDDDEYDKFYEKAIQDMKIEIAKGE